MLRVLLSLVLAGIWLSGQAQHIIPLDNPSLEDFPRANTAPVGWHDCRTSGYTAPSVLPLPRSVMRVKLAPEDGQSYVGLPLRKNGTAAAIGQRLPRPLLPGQCYALSMSLARSPRYNLVLPHNYTPVNHADPVVLTLLGGRDSCARAQLLGETSVVPQPHWRRFRIYFQPQDTVTHITLQPWFMVHREKDYGGHVLIDNLGPIVPVDCHTREPLADRDTFLAPRFDYNRIYERHVAEVRLMLDQICRVLLFEPGSAWMKSVANRALYILGLQLRKYQDLQVVIYVKPYDERMARFRARYLRHQLYKTGVRLHRMQIRAEAPGPPGEQPWYECENAQLRIYIFRKGKKKLWMPPEEARRLF